MSRLGIRCTLQVIVTLGFLKLMVLIALAMVLHFRGQWMLETDKTIKDLAESTQTIMELSVKNRTTLSEIRRAAAQLELEKE